MNSPSSASAAAPRYTRIAIALHWVMALMIVGAFVAGTILDGMDFSPFKLKLISWHKWLGVSIFAFVCFRIVWRLTHRPPPLPTSTPPWQRTAAAAGHLALYGLMVIIPLSGWLYSSAAGIQTVWFGLVPLPDLLARNEQTADLLRTVHGWLNNGLLVVVLGHVAAALHHHYRLRDGLLTRMRPYWTRR
jgi:cytochrome b561